MLFGFLVNASIVGLVIAAMEGEGFPGWPATLGFVFSIWLTEQGLGQLLPDELGLLALVGGAVVGGLVISRLCEIAPMRALRAAAYYLGFRIVIALAFHALITA